jgi:magnesium transporter
MPRYYTGMDDGKTLTYDGKFKDKKTEFYLMEYDGSSYSYNKIKVKDIPSEGSGKIRWIQVRGMSDIAPIKKLAKKFNIHSLTLRNIFDLEYRSGLLSHGERMACVFNFPRWPKGELDFHFERTSVIRIRKNNTIITFEENPKSLFGQIPQFVEENEDDIKSGPVDHLLFLIMEEILGRYFTTNAILSEMLRGYGKELNQEGVEKETFANLHSFKGKVMKIVDSIEPLKNSIEQNLRLRVEEKEEYSLIHARIIYQHLGKIIDQLEHLEARCSHAFELAISLNDYKMNEVMKNLTIIATIFLPLTFIAGVYGMNFKFMPELDQKYAYYACLGLMVVVAIGILIYFKKKKWI